MRSKILLPDGFCLMEIYNHFKGVSSLSEVPPEHVASLQTQPRVKQPYDLPAPH